ncbi:MAG TPA: SprT-like domain-containing protein [Verrucomicrobiae bacterium]
MDILTCGDAHPALHHLRLQSEAVWGFDGGDLKDRTQETLAKLHRELERWCTLWGLYRLSREAKIAFSTQLGLALGKCDPKSGQILLNGVLLLPENEKLLFETLCHEAAHITAHLRYGPAIEEHGVEWQEYMEKAGFVPRPVIEVKEVFGLAVSARTDLPQG